MEPFLIDVKPHAGAPVLSTHEGEEFIFVLDGEIEVSYGTETHRLGAGDSIYYDSIVPHHLHAAGEKDAKILAVVYAPY
jgi:quercetin dioxygenase-like cupin family protein